MLVCGLFSSRIYEDDGREVFVRSLASSFGSLLISSAAAAGHIAYQIEKDDLKQGMRVEVSARLRSPEAEQVRGRGKELWNVRALQQHLTQTHVSAATFSSSFPSSKMLHLY